MMYFTKEELEEITGKLLDNPTRETLKELNNKYNGVEMLNNNEVVEMSVETPQSYEIPPVVEQPVEEQIVNQISPVEVQQQVMVEQPTTPIPAAVVEEQVANPIPPVMDNQVVTPIPNYETPVEAPIPVVETPVMSVEQPIINQVDQNIPANNMNVDMQVPSFEIPQVTPNVDNSINNEPINFTGNLWEPQNQNDLMATTDSFNAGPIEQNTQIPVGNEPFFGGTTEQVNNPIPINNSMPQMPQGPSMFGQFEQNYNI